MAEDNTQEGQNQQPNADEALKNLKSEFSRKQENTMKELESIKNMLGSLNQSMTAKQKQAESDEIPDPVLDPKGYKEHLKKEVMQETGQIMQQNNQRQSQLAALVQSYPELQNGSSDLTQKAVEIYSKLSEAEKMSPNAYKFAVQDAASELGVLPMSKRTKNEQNSDSEDFTIDSTNYSSNQKKSSKNSKSQELDPMTLAFAKAIGKDINDPKYIESLKKAAGRKNWKKFE